MQYNTTKDALIMPEYGRHVHNMINHAISLKDKKQQQECVDSIIKFMGQMNPHLRDVKAYTHKLWDHLHIMSNFKLEIDSPYPKPELEKLESKPEKMQYPSNKIKFSYYGNIGHSQRPVVSSNPNEIFAFCIACPEDPLTKLSITENKIHLLGLLSWTTPIWQKLDPVT